jgi:aerobic-type carbon monoxide dehydrogenase small subunit (CoxS/CutS family)
MGDAIEFGKRPATADIDLTVNGRAVRVGVAPPTPLIAVLCNTLGLT